MHSYCTLNRQCDPVFSIGACWGWFSLQWMFYSTLAIYFENVLPDSLGASKPMLFFLSASYWGLGPSSPPLEPPKSPDADEEDDIDVTAEAASVRVRAGEGMCE